MSSTKPRRASWGRVGTAAAFLWTSGGGEAWSRTVAPKAGLPSAPMGALGAIQTGTGTGFSSTTDLTSSLGWGANTLEGLQMPLPLIEASPSEAQHPNPAGQAIPDPAQNGTPIREAIPPTVSLEEPGALQAALEIDGAGKILTEPGASGEEVKTLYTHKLEGGRSPDPGSVDGAAAVVPQADTSNPGGGAVRPIGVIQAALANIREDRRVLGCSRAGSPAAVGGGPALKSPQRREPDPKTDGGITLRIPIAPRSLGRTLRWSGFAVLGYLPVQAVLFGISTGLASYVLPAYLAVALISLGRYLANPKPRVDTNPLGLLTYPDSPAPGQGNGIVWTNPEPEHFRLLREVGAGEGLWLTRFPGLLRYQISEWARAAASFDYRRLLPSSLLPKSRSSVIEILRWGALGLVPLGPIVALGQPNALYIALAPVGILLHNVLKKDIRGNLGLLLRRVRPPRPDPGAVDIFRFEGGGAPTNLKWALLITGTIGLSLLLYLALPAPYNKLFYLLHPLAGLGLWRLAGKDVLEFLRSPLKSRPKPSILKGSPIRYPYFRYKFRRPFLLTGALGLSLLSYLMFPLRPPAEPVRTVEVIPIYTGPLIYHPPVFEQRAQGGGGGGQRGISAPAKKPRPKKGNLPKIKEEQLAPPVKPVHPDPKLPAESSLQGNEKLSPPVPETDPAKIGSPEGTSEKTESPEPGKIPGAEPGAGSGVGGGQGTGVGEGKGPGAGEGEGGGAGGGKNNNKAGTRDLKSPQLLDELPELTEEAAKAGYRGSVILSFQVGLDGRVTGPIRVIKGAPHGLTDRAAEFVRKSRWKPAQKLINNVWTDIPGHFREYEFEFTTSRPGRNPR